MLSGVASTGVRETSVLGEDKAGVVGLGEDIPVPTSGVPERKSVDEIYY